MNKGTHFRFLKSNYSKRKTVLMKTLFSDVEKEMSDYAELPDIPLKKAQLIYSCCNV
jgi:hypothetical protein